MKPTKIAFYGIGNFGYAFLRHFDRKNNGSLELTAYDHNPSRVAYLRKHRKHPTLHTDTRLSDSITFVDNAKDLFARGCDILLLGVPSTACIDAISTSLSYLDDPAVIVNTAKALDKPDGQRLSIAAGELLSGSPHIYALIAGGTIANDLFMDEPLGATIASVDAACLPSLKSLFQSGSLCVHTTTDLAGVEYASAFKNIISILSGVVSGLGMSYGSETHIISRTAGQIGDACVEHLGAKPRTFSISSQCWGNDMWMSCTGNTRNRAFGTLLGKGMSVDKALAHMAKQNKIVEGINTLEVIKHIPEIYAIPVIKILYEVVVEKSKPAMAIREYMLSMY